MKDLIYGSSARVLFSLLEINGKKQHNIFGLKNLISEDLANLW